MPGAARPERAGATGASLLHPAKIRPDMDSPAIDDLVASRLGERFELDASLVKSVLAALETGTPVPYLARYRREQVGGLGEDELRALRDEAEDLREFENRREFVMRAVAERDVPEKVRKRIAQCRRRLELEYLYEPYRPPRKTPGSLARAAGLEPLAESLLRNEEVSVEAFADAEKGVASPEAAVEGARDILAERFAVDPDVRSAMLRAVEKNSTLETRPAPGKREIPKRYSQFRTYSQKLPGIPPHRLLSLLRAESEGALALDVTFPDDKVRGVIEQRFYPNDVAEPVKVVLDQAMETALRLLRPAIVRDGLGAVKARADAAVVQSAAKGLRDLLLFPAAGPQRVMGVDPAPRGAVPVACVDERGQPLDHAKLKFFGKDQEKVAATRARLAELVQTHDVALIALGNGQGRRECEGVLLDALGDMGEDMPPIVVVNEAGVGSYASGPSGRSDLPALPVPARAAVSIARRLIDPLAELVKVDPRQLGGPHLNEVDDALLGRTLSGVVESCVGYVGADVNRAAAPLLARVCGLSASVARQVVEHREKNGFFPDRASVAALPFVTERAFEWSAGFLRVRGANPLDATGLHPAHYPLAERIGEKLGCPVAELVGDSDRLDKVVAEEFADETFGPATVAGALYELLVGDADPRPKLEIARRDPGVRTVEDLKSGMRLPGRVTNVTNFGAFVDVGVRQDGLVHVSELANHFVKDPTQVVRSGEVVEVRVLGVDRETGRISLSMRSEREGGRGRERGGGRDRGDRRRGRGGPRRERRQPSDRPEAAPVPESPEEAAPLVPDLPENPVPENMTEEEFMRQKMEELKKRFS